MTKHPDVSASPEIPETELERVRTQNAELLVLVEQLRQRAAALEARLNKDSHNSSKPPSSDSKLKKPPPRSQRKATGRKPGGQAGHPGATLDLVDAPEERVVVPLSGSCECGRWRGEIAVDMLPERRQVVELEIRRKVTEYRTVAGTCACGRAHRSDFPETVGAPVQYGPSVSALAVYLTQYQLLPYQRTAELTAYFPHAKRGTEALGAFGLLEWFTGILVHDHWSAYERYRCLHAFCNAHHLRELIALAETIPSQQRWAEDMIALLCEANTVTASARIEGLEALPTAEVERLHARYDAILEAAAQRNPERLPPPGSRRRVKQSPAYNLSKRLSEKRDDVLRFITDLRVPFDHNLAVGEAHFQSGMASGPCSKTCSRSKLACAFWLGVNVSKTPWSLPASFSAALLRKGSWQERCQTITGKSGASALISRRLQRPCYQERMERLLQPRARPMAVATRTSLG